MYILFQPKVLKRSTNRREYFKTSIVQYVDEKRTRRPFRDVSKCCQTFCWVKFQIFENIARIYDFWIAGSLNVFAYIYTYICIYLYTYTCIYTHISIPSNDEQNDEAETIEVSICCAAKLFTRYYNHMNKQICM